MISLNYRDSRPIYEQIKEGIINLAVTGALGAGDKLPSVRELAMQLAINPNTIQRAYRELESIGYVYSIPGKGSFIAENNATQKKIDSLFKKFDDAVTELKRLGITADALVLRLTEGGKTA